MKTSILLFFCLVLSARQSFAQSDSAFIGLWKAVGISNEDFYVNKRSDSFYFSEKVRPELRDSASLAKAMRGLDDILNEIEISFDENGSYKSQFEAPEIEKGQYVIDTKQSEIEFTWKSSNGTEKKQVRNYSWTDGLLNLVYEAPNGTEIVFILDKDR